MMVNTGTVTTRWVDLLGGMVVVGCLLGACWLTFVHSEGTRQEVAEVSQRLVDAANDVASLQAAFDKQTLLTAERSKELAERGQLPTRATVEPFFRELSRIAMMCGLNVVSQSPRTPQQYPGLLEQRFTYDVTGPTNGIVRFLAEIEATEFWADVSHLRVQRGLTAEDATESRRAASLTLSLFSALPTEPVGDRPEGT